MQASSVIDRAAVDSQVEPLIRVAQNHAGGKEAYARSIAIELFEDFLSIEERFAAKKSATEQEIIDSMRLVQSPVQWRCTWRAVCGQGSLGAQMSWSEEGQKANFVGVAGLQK